MKDDRYLQRIVSWDDYIDPELTEEENLLFQLNNDNHTDYDSNDVEFSLPETTSIVIIDHNSPNDPIEVNTKILVSARTTSEYRGSDYYYYRRIDIAEQWRILNGNDSIAIPSTLLDEYDIKQYLRKKMPYRLDSINIVLEKISNENYITLKPIDNSLLYIGEIKLKRIGINSPIGKIKRMNPIKGLDYYVPSLEINSQGFNYTNKGRVRLDGFYYTGGLVINSKGLNYNP